MAVDTLGHLLALHVTLADEQDRSQVGKLVQAVQEEICSSVEIAFVDQGYTGETAANEAGEHGVALHVVKLPEAKRGFVLLPRRWVIERSFGWAARFRRLVGECRQVDHKTVRCTGGFDEKPVPGLRIDVLDDKDRILIRGRLDAQASFTFEKPAVPFYVLIDAGPGLAVEIDDDELKPR